ncbi:MAG: type 4a pilus biogenesis protein PilO, partial [Candidatus Omnitrophica bacterium]|nr:type 4a pilus biogenesis protein PilO [Candidatus Omnitrophota bacterium]
IAQTKSDIKRDVRFLSYQKKIEKENELYRVYQTDEKKSDEEIIAAFLKTIENLGREAEVVVGKLNPGESVPKKGYVQYFANVECNGKLENIIKFVHKIDTTNNLLKVVKMNVIGKKTSADEVTVTMKISKLIIDAKASAGAEPADVSAIQDVLPATAGGAVGAGGMSAAPQPGVAGGARPKSLGASGGASGGRGGSGAGGEKETSGGGVGGGAGGGGTGGGGGGSGSGSGDAAVGGGGGTGGDGGGSSGGGQPGDQSSAGETGGGGGAGASGDAGGDPGDANGGTAGSAGGSSSAEPNDPKAPKAGEKTQPEKKVAAPIEDLSQGERLKVKKGIEEVWNDFWGIKPKVQAPKAAPPSGKKKFNKDEYKTEAELKPNLWERLLDKKK